MTALVIGFAGLTHLGLVSAVAAAAKGFCVVGFDGDAARIADVAAGRLPVLEPGLDDLPTTHSDKLTFSGSPAALAVCDVVYIASDVPTDDSGRSDLSGIDRLIAEVTASLNGSAVLVILCQVPPGYTRRIGWPQARIFRHREIRLA